MNEPDGVDVVVIVGGQAGLAMGYQLARRGLRFVILEAHARVGDGWRTRWDSLRLFTPAGHDALPGLRFRAPPRSFPTKDQMADYLERYAATFEALTGSKTSRQGWSDLHGRSAYRPVPRVQPPSSTSSTGASTQPVGRATGC